MVARRRLAVPDRRSGRHLEPLSRGARPVTVFAGDERRNRIEWHHRDQPRALDRFAGRHGGVHRVHSRPIRDLRARQRERPRAVPVRERSAAAMLPPVERERGEIATLLADRRTRASAADRVSGGGIPLGPLARSRGPAVDFGRRGSLWPVSRRRPVGFVRRHAGRSDPRRGAPAQLGHDQRFQRQEHGRPGFILEPGASLELGSRRRTDFLTSAEECSRASARSTGSRRNSIKASSSARPSAAWRASSRTRSTVRSGWSSRRGVSQVVQDQVIHTTAFSLRTGQLLVGRDR